ncbi:pantetheine-phosphate adenylyltransferase [Candidatus Anaplasma sp. TIGMIC]|uniref:pantetheine-phosphate adenylyltransferase n=1 Tax=Candidatus Anaplasma sp. TIGMIC TaxID=3020713 RepID=UPI00232DB4A6|nr:pantetheine-phosphate adenylyltransferase [Candidatus Anaplasma sp. TIGMIC]MDB1135694.1 pantetheine-phosphate adenylyltransferase [Candidatus Anaplasma sp. TIGMIC]
MTKTLGIYPGTFDPITLGHLDIINRACKLVDELVVAVADRARKETAFSAELRAEMIVESVKDLEHSSSIKVEVFNGLLASFAKRKNALMIIRGLRAVSDFDYEFQMSWVNYKLTPGMETVFLPAAEETQFISSSFVKEVARLGGDPGVFVPKIVNECLKNFYGRQKTI